MSDAERDFTEATASLEPIDSPTNNILAALDTSAQAHDAVAALRHGGCVQSEVGIGSGVPHR